MGTVSAAIKMLIANVIIAIILGIAQLGFIVVLQAPSIQEELGTVLSDPGTATALPTTVIALLVGYLVFAILLQGFVVNRLWGWK